MERWRKRTGKSVRHWLITELGHGTTEHLHLHGIIWTDEVERIEKDWGYGWVWTGKLQPNGKRENYVNGRTITYISKYVTKKDEIHKTYKPIILNSPGIGKGYTETYNATKNKYKPGETKETYTTTTGIQIGMPIYWRNKLYTETERENLWLEKLDKQERWICGEKISIKDNEEEYWRTLQYYQTLNEEKGYGSNEKNWEREKYENELRILKQGLRKEKNNKKGKIKNERRANERDAYEDYLIRNE